MSSRFPWYGLMGTAGFALSTGVLLFGYLSSGWWLILVIFPVILLLPLVSKHYPQVCIPSVLFGGYIFLACVGLWIGLMPHLMVYGSIVALAGWELKLFEKGIAGRHQHESTPVLQRQHLKSLGIVIFLGFLVTTIGLSLRLDLPFGIIVMLALFGGLILERVYFYLNQETP